MSDTKNNTYAVSLCGEYMRDITGVNAADEFVDDVLTRTAPSGEHVLGAIGPSQDADSFSARLFIAVEHPHAYLRWDDTVGAEPNRPTPAESDSSLVVEEDLGEIVELPPSQLLVSPGRARQAVREYVETGQRPTCVTWQPESD